MYGIKTVYGNWKPLQLKKKNFKKHSFGTYLDKYLVNIYNDFQMRDYFLVKTCE